MSGPQAARLPGDRLHLNHGPIDLVIGAEGAGRDAFFHAAAQRFATILEELVAELPDLRRPDAPPPSGPTARRMQAATAPFAPEFITPMAAVAGAVAEEVLSQAAGMPDLQKAYVNDGGDIAFLLAPGATFTAAMAGGTVTIPADTPWRGIATSGQGGRSHSLGIADSVTVIARGAALADAAATMIANRVDLPGHPAVRRVPARDLAPDSDLGDRRVTTALGPLTPAEVDRAIAAGRAYAETLIARGLIGGVALTLNHRTALAGAAHDLTKDPAHA
ncbi:UPF0280 family protein [Pseudooceanicola sp. LIPI14-2-Ac024]|uniref:UPF0280 family protein n=1 Tax=Pseudooceanicola sp. LIPI14-2-Ac024 TaxID=3344875 RepID=UPI0035CF4728